MNNTLTIPQTRERFMLIADELEDNALQHGAQWALNTATEIRNLVLMGMYRRPGVYTAIKSRKMTPAIRHLIRATKTANPGWSHQQIADYVGVNTGRVSETLRGFR